jgi:hypothetical protein
MTMPIIAVMLSQAFPRLPFSNLTAVPKCGKRRRSCLSNRTDRSRSRIYQTDRRVCWAWLRGGSRRMTKSTPGNGSVLHVDRINGAMRLCQKGHEVPRERTAGGTRREAHDAARQAREVCRSTRSRSVSRRRSAPPQWLLMTVVHRLESGRATNSPAAPFRPD